MLWRSAVGRIVTFAKDHIDLFLVCGDVRNHAFVVGDHLNLARHVAQIDQKAVDLGHPQKRVPIDQTSWPNT